MSRSLLAALLFGSCAFAAIWPPQLGTYQRKSAQSAAPSADAHLQAAEDGLQETEVADYGSFTVKAERFKDPTGAYAASLDPANRLKSRIGNYLLSCDGQCPLDLASLAESAFPHVSHASTPTLGDYLPARNRIPRSERYILGPVSLGANLPEIPPTAAAFQFGTEAEVAQYRFGQSTATLAVFSYPSPQIARQQAPKFQSITGAEVKRTGSFVVIALAPSPIAKTLLSEVNYNGQVQINETPPLVLRPETAGQMLVSIINLAGLVLGFCLVSGLLVAGALFAARRRFGYSGADGTLTTLHLGRK